MVQATSCIRVCSDLNEWIDICFVIGAYEDLAKAEDILSEAYDEWWEAEEAHDIPIGEWLCQHLDDNDIDYEIFYAEEEQ